MATPNMWFPVARVESGNKFGAIGLLLFTLAIVLAQAAPATAQNADELRFRTITPLGTDALLLQPAKKLISMLLTLDCKALDDARVVEKGSRKFVITPEGTELLTYPSELKFRFTVGSRTVLGEKDPLEVQTSSTPEEFETHLHFRLKVFHGVDTQTVVPVESKIVGVPPEMPYDERIYRISFKLPEIPAGDRMMFEVLDDSGARVAKFHLQLM